MDCKTARLLLEFARPGHLELDPEESLALETHLRDCSDCGPIAQVERSLDEQLGHAMREVSIPADLRPRLLAHVAGARRSYYRRLAGRLSLAAAVLVAVVAGAAYWMTSFRTTVNLAAL